MEEALACREGNAGAISLRSAIVGGTVRDKPEVSPPELFRDARRLIVFVHGFNVTKEDADASYDAFESGMSRDSRQEIVRLYWPGDSSTRGDSARGEQGLLTRIISPLSYALKPKRALQSSQKLRQLLMEAFEARAKRRRNDKLELCFVAHSLGCRLTLEGLERAIIAKGSIADFPLVVLMAAAVPLYAVTGEEAFAELMKDLPKVWVLHSRRDATLRRWFRPGQLFERAAFPDFRLSVRGALGRRGMQGSASIKVLEGIWDHSDYWPDRDIAEAIDVELGGTRPEHHVFENLSRKVAERAVRERTARQRAVAQMMVDYRMMG